MISRAEDDDVDLQGLAVGEAYLMVGEGEERRAVRDYHARGNFLVEIASDGGVLGKQPMAAL